VDGAQDHSAGDTSVLDAFALLLTDANGQTASDSLDILITDTQLLAEGESHALVEDSGSYAVEGDALANDTAFDGPVTFAGWSAGNAALYGSVTLNADGTYGYVLDNAHPLVNLLQDGQVLIETFSYTVQDADGDQAIATVTIRIEGHTDGPPSISVPDSNGPLLGDHSIAEDAGTPISGSFSIAGAAGIVSLQIADTTLTLAQLQALSPATPVSLDTAKGLLTLTGFDGSTGEISYSYRVDGAQDHSAGDASVLDAFALLLTDANGQTASDSLDILITDTQPVAEGESHALVEDSGSYAVEGDALANDSAFDGPVTFAGWSAGNAAQYGSVTLNADGTYGYVLDNAHPLVNLLQDGQVLTETFSYTVQDADGDQAIATVTIRIEGHTDGPPSISVPDSNGPLLGDHSIAEDAGAPVTGSFSVSSAAGIASLQVAGTTLTLAQLQALSPATPVTLDTAKGLLTLTGFDGTTGEISYSYRVDGAQDHSAGDASVLDAFALLLTDANGQTASDSLDILITDTQPVAEGESHALVEDSGSYAVEGDALANDSAFDGPLTFAGWNAGNAAQYGSVTLNADGTYGYVLDNAHPLVNLLQDGQVLIETFSYTVQDADGDQAIATVTIHIEGHTDGPPSISVPDSNGPLLGDHSIAEDAGTPISGSFSLAGAAGIVSLQIADTTLTLVQLQALSPATPVTLDSAKGLLTLTGFDGSSVSYSYAVDGAQDHSAGDTSVLDAFALLLTDANGQTASDSLDILITDTQLLAEGESHALVEDSGSYAVEGDALANDTAFDGPVTFAGWSAGNAALYGSVTLNADGTYGYVLDNAHPLVNLLQDGQVLIETFSYTVQDADGDQAIATVTIRIEGHTDGPPSISVPDSNGPLLGDHSIAEDAGTPISGSFSIAGAAGIVSLQIADTTLTLAQLQALSPATPVSLDTAKGLLTLTGFDGSTGEISYSYRVDGAQDHSAGDASVLDAFALLLTDANGQTASDSLDILITDTQPVAEGESHALVEDSGSYAVEGDALANDSAFDGPVTFAGWSAGNAAQYGSVTLNADGTYGYVLDNAHPLVNLLQDGQVLTETFSYTVQDADGDQAIATVTIHIEGHTDGPPSISVPDSNGPLLGDHSIAEDAGTPVTGSFSLAGAAGIVSLQIAGTTLTLAQLQALSPATPVTLDTAKGLLTLTGFDGSSVSYSYAVDGAQDHSAGDTSVLDAFALLLTDANGQTASDSLDILITDTQPVLGTLAPAVLNLEAGTTAIGDLNLEPIVDLDGASISFRGAVDASGYILSTTLNEDGTTTAAYLTYQGSKLTYVSNPDGSLTAVVAGTSTAIFTVSANPLTGLYSIELLQDLDPAITTAPQENFTISGGNQDSYTVSAALGEQFNLVATALESNGTAATVNTSNFSFGVSDGQSIDQGEKLTFQFLDQSTNAAAGMSSLSLTALQLGYGESLTWQAFDASGAQIATGTVQGQNSQGTHGSALDIAFTITDAGARIASITLTSDTASTSFKLELEAVSGQSSTHAQQIELYATAHDGDGDSSAEQSLSVTFEPDSALAAGDSGSALAGDSADNLLIGSDEDDILIGGAGDDTLTGGDGADTFVWRNGDTGNDVVTDFNPREGDSLDLSDLLQGANESNILDFLTLDQGTSTLRISTTGEFGTGGSGTVDATIQLQDGTGGALDLSAYGSSANDIITAMVEQSVAKVENS
jgi:VCBS repeat-containing protein